MENRIKVFLFGECKNNTGPENVNRNLINNCNYNMDYVKFNGKIKKRVEILYKILKNDVIVYSGIKTKFWVFLSKLFNKKTVYLMHGCISYESEINKLNTSNKILSYEKNIFESVDLILPVSEQYKNWVIHRYPDLENKLHFLNSGIIGGGYNLML